MQEFYISTVRIFLKKKINQDWDGLKSIYESNTSVRHPALKHDLSGYNPARHICKK